MEFLFYFFSSAASGEGALSSLFFSGVVSGASTTLSTAMASDATSLSLTNATDFNDTSGKFSYDSSSQYWIKINDEIMKYTVISGTSVSSVTVSASTATYSLSSSTIDALEVVLNRDSTDIQLQRVTPEEYLLIPNKTQTGRPTQYSIRRERDNPVMSVWPLPDNSTDILKMEIISELQDVNKSAIQNADLPKRFLPCLTCGLAYYMSMKRPGVPENRIMMLKANYEELLARAMEEDRERASMFIRPRLRYV